MICFCFVTLTTTSLASFQPRYHLLDTVTASYIWPPRQNEVTVDPNSNELIQVSVLLPHYFKYNVQLEAAQKRAGAGILQGFIEADRRGLFELGAGQQLTFNVTFRDSRCDNTYGPKSFTDAIVGGVHALFGPSCEYALGKKAKQQQSKAAVHYRPRIANKVMVTDVS